MLLQMQASSIITSNYTASESYKQQMVNNVFFLTMVAPKWKKVAKPMKMG